MKNNKKAYCTYCSREKRKDPCLLQAIERYDNDRIRATHKQALNDGVEFLILSGEYGVVNPSTQIPYYDHLLKREEVGALIERVTVQLQERQISELVYFTKPWENDPEIRPYLDTITASCCRLNITFKTEPISK